MAVGGLEREQPDGAVGLRGGGLVFVRRGGRIRISNYLLCLRDGMVGFSTIMCSTWMGWMGWMNQGRNYGTPPEFPFGNAMLDVCSSAPRDTHNTMERCEL